jgi:hypothetical protein
MRTSSDSVPIVLTPAAFVLMLLGQTSYERLLDAWMVKYLEPWIGATAAPVAERCLAVAVADSASLYIVGGLYFYLRRNLAAQSGPLPRGSSRQTVRIPARRDVWLYDAICRIFLGRRDRIRLQ